MSPEQDHLSPQHQAPPALKEQQKRALPVTEYLLHVLALGLVMARHMVLPVPQRLPRKDDLFFKVLKVSSPQSPQVLPLSHFLGFLPADAVFSLLS